MGFKQVLLLCVANAFLVATENATKTFNVTSLDGTVKQYTFPWQQYSECLYTENVDILKCMDNYPYNQVVPVWKSHSEQIKYVSVNCLLTNQKQQGTCFCKSRSSNPGNELAEDKYFGCNIEKLENGIFSRINSTEVLDMSNNIIQSIERGSFSGLNNLRYCSLDGNLFHDLPSGLFCDTPNIEYVSLKGLNLDIFPSHSFICKLPLTKLDIINMKGSNIKDVPADSLDYLPGLRSLDLGDNGLVQIYKKSFAGGIALRHLNLSGNALTFLFPHFCDYLQNLTHLHLRENNFTTFSFEELEGCAALNDLDLSQNRIGLMTGNVSASSSLVKLNFSRNNVLSLGLSLQGLTHLESLDLSQNKMTRLAHDQFIGLENLKLLNVSRNALTISDNLVSVLEPLTNTEILDLSNNVLTALPNNSFKSMPTLKELFLGNNMIRVLPRDIFTGLASLERLELDFNQLTALPDGVIEPLKSLKYLSLSSNKISSLGIQTWPSLLYLKVANNDISTLPPTLQFSELEALDMSHNQLSSFVGSGENLFVNFNKLKSLDLSFNRINDISPMVFQTMRDITILNLENNQLTLNFSQSLLRNTTVLTNLNVASNKIEDIHAIFSHNSLSNLTFLDVSSNPLFKIEQLSNTSNAHLEVLHISNCNLSSLRQDLFSNFLALKIVDITENNLETFPAFKANVEATFYLTGNPLICACNMSWLLDSSIEVGGIRILLSRYKIPKCRVYTENTVYNPAILERRQYLCPEFETCDPKCTCFKVNQTGPATTVICRNNLKVVPSVMSSSALSLFLDGNDFSGNDSLAPFLKFKNMVAKEIYLNASVIASVDQRMFLSFADVEILSLEENVLEMLPSGIFANKKSLKQLYLKNNLIRYFEQDVFKTLPNLDELDISGNNLVKLEPYTLSELSALDARYFFLASNPWACNCSNKGFKMFVDTFEFRIRDRRNLFCDASNREILQLSMLSFSCDVTAQAESRGKPAIIVGIIIAIIIFIVIFAVVVYYRRELVAVLYYKTGCHCPGRKYHPGMHFDVYVSYDPKDQHCSLYVQDTLLPKLKNNSYNVQTATDLIEDVEVIQKVVEDSKSSIFIVNQNFASNAFQMKVFLGAVHAHNVDKLHKVVLIIHGDIELNTLEPELMKRMRKGDYITSRSRLWWERLIYELPVPTGLANATENDDVSESDVIVFSSLNRDQYDPV